MSDAGALDAAAIGEHRAGQGCPLIGIQRESLFIQLAAIDNQDSLVGDNIVNLGIQHETLEILVADQLRQQPVVEFARSQHFDCIITQMQSVQLCVWVIFLFCQPQQVIGGHAVELCQLHHAERADVLEIVGFVFSQRGL